jgi:hypothetical protein
MLGGGGGWRGGRRDVNSDHLGGNIGIRVGGTDISGSIKFELINLIIFFPDQLAENATCFGEQVRTSSLILMKLPTVL